MTTRLPLSQLTRTQLIKLTDVPIIDMAINDFLDAWIQARQVFLSNQITMESMETMARCKEELTQAKRLLNDTLDGYKTAHKRTKSTRAMNNKLLSQNRMLSFNMLMSEFSKYKRATTRRYNKTNAIPTVPTGLAGFTFAEAS